MTMIVKIIDNQMVLYEQNNLYNPIKKFYQPFVFDGDIITLKTNSANGDNCNNSETYELVTSPIRMNILIGYFSTSQQVKFGKSASGATIYQVTPFNSALPYFLISYAGKLTGKLIITFRFKDWTKGLPRGEIVQVIGLMDFTNLITTLQYSCGVYRKECKIKPTKNINESSLYRTEITECIFSIDPIGCTDIDDAMSWTESNDNYNIKIHIAQPIYWLTELELVERAKSAFSTLYQDPYKHNSNLWGDEITKQSSLLAGVKRPGYTMEFVIDKKTYKVIKFTHYPTWITNSYAVDYESCLDIPIINKFYEITKIISDKNCSDTHELVSYWMIMANNFLGESEQIKNLNIPYRISLLGEKEKQHFDNIDDCEVRNAFYNMTSESATYSIDDMDNYHSGLKVKNYIHFTSPIRRIVDALIHWCLTYNINFKTLLTKYSYDLSSLNILDKKTKKFHQQIKFLSIIDNLNLEENETMELSGWIYEKSGNRWTIYFKELGFVKVKMWDLKFNYLVEKKEKDTVEFLNTGEKLKCNISKKPGFMPKEKILIVPSLNLI